MLRLFDYAASCGRRHAAGTVILAHAPHLRVAIGLMGNHGQTVTISSTVHQKISLLTLVAAEAKWWHLIYLPEGYHTPALRQSRTTHTQFDRGLPQVGVWSGRARSTGCHTDRSIKDRLLGPSLGRRTNPSALPSSIAGFVTFRIRPVSEIICQWCWPARRKASPDRPKCRGEHNPAQQRSDDSDDDNADDNPAPAAPWESCLRCRSKTGSRVARLWGHP